MISSLSDMLQETIFLLTCYIYLTFSRQHTFGVKYAASWSLYVLKFSMELRFEIIGIFQYSSLPLNRTFSYNMDWSDHLLFWLAFSFCGVNISNSPLHLFFTRWLQSDFKSKNLNAKYQSDWNLLWFKI